MPPNPIREENRLKDTPGMSPEVMETHISIFKNLGDEIRTIVSSIAQISCVCHMGKLVLLLLWHFLHLGFSIWYFVLSIAHMIHSYLISSGILEKYKSLDLRSLRYLAIVIESEDARYTPRVVELVQWLSAIGVKHVCLYDMDGVLKKSKEIILEKSVGCQEANERISSLDQKKMTLEFISFSDGKEGMAKAASFLCSKYLKAVRLGTDHEETSFTELQLTLALRAIGCGGPDPDLLLIYGPARCHLGFPAWRMRYTEIVHMGPLKSMKYGALVKAIHKFTMIHQNYGT